MLKNVHIRRNALALMCLATFCGGAHAANITVISSVDGSTENIACLDGNLTATGEAILTDQDLQACLSEFGSVELSTGGAGNISFQSNVSFATETASTLGVIADGDVTIQNQAEPVAPLSLDVNNGGSFTVGKFSSGGGSVTVRATSFMNQFDTLDTTGGDITLEIDGSVTNRDGGIRNAGQVLVRSTGNITSSASGVVSGGGWVTLISGASVFISDSGLSTNSGNASVQAEGSIQISGGGINLGGGNVVLEAGDSLLIRDGGVRTGGGTATLTAGSSGTLTGGALSTEGGNTIIRGDGLLDIDNGGISSGAGTIQIESGGPLSLADNGLVSTGGDISVTSSTSLTLAVNSRILSGGGNILLRTFTTMQLDDEVNSTPGSGGILSVTDPGSQITQNVVPTPGAGNITLISGYLDTDRDGILDEEDPFPLASTTRSIDTRSLSIIPSSDSSGCSVDELSFSAPGDLPEAPVGIIAGDVVTEFTLENCLVGETVTVTIDYGSPIASGAGAFKIGEGWTAIEGASVSGSQLTYQITDGGAYDADGEANGVIVDPLILGLTTASIPTAPLWAIVGMMLGLAGLGLGGRGVGRRPA